MFYMQNKHENLVKYNGEPQIETETLFKEFQPSSVLSWKPAVKQLVTGMIIEGSKPSQAFQEQKLQVLHQQGKPIEFKYQMNSSFKEEEKLFDDRKEHVAKPFEFPHSINVFLEMDFPDGSYRGSGCIIGPQHILTCGHNVFDPKTQQWADR